MNEEEIISYINGKNGSLSNYMFDCDHLVISIKGIFLSEMVFKKHNELFEKLGIGGLFHHDSIGAKYEFYIVYSDRGNSVVLDLKGQREPNERLKQIHEVISLYDEIYELCTELEIFGVEIR